MNLVVIQFPGSNRDRDAISALAKICDGKITLAQSESDITDDVDLIIVPGGFSYGDYLRAGAIAASSNIMKKVCSLAEKGVRVLGICNGFQILCEAKLLPGVLLHNKSLNFVCREILLEVVQTKNPFTKLYNEHEIIRCPVAHQQGNYFASTETLKKLKDNEQIVLKYAKGTNPNGSKLDIAAISNERGNVLGLMPHPENFIEESQGCDHGRRLLEGALA